MIGSHNVCLFRRGRSDLPAPSLNEDLFFFFFSHKQKEEGGNEIVRGELLCLLSSSFLSTSLESLQDTGTLGTALLW